MCDDDEYFPQCIACFDHYDEQERVPIVLNCGHSICKSCLTLLYNGAAEKKCPKCRQDLGGLLLRKNFALMDVTASVIDLIQNRSSGETRYQNEISKKNEEIRKLRDEIETQSEFIHGLTKLLEETSEEVKCGEAVMKSQHNEVEKLNEDAVLKLSLLKLKEEQMKLLQKPQLKCSECEICQKDKDLVICQTCILRRKGINCSKLQNNPQLGDIDIKWYGLCSQCGVKNHATKEHIIMEYKTVSSACNLQRQIVAAGPKTFVPETMQNNVFIRNLARSVDDKKLEQIFKLYGTVLSAKVVRNPDGQSKGFGFVCYQEEKHARIAISKMHDSFVDGRKLHVALHQKKDRAALLAQKHKRPNRSEVPKANSVQSLRRSNMSQKAGPTHVTGPLPPSAQTVAPNFLPARTFDQAPTQFTFPFLMRKFPFTD